jgi:basic amino acid/polyamine antiporter, APA family
VAVSAIIGGYGVLSVDNCFQITLASNTGTFLLYGLTNFIALWAFLGRKNTNFLTHKVVPLLGFLANAVMLVGVFYLDYTAGGSTSNDTVIALAMVIVWMIVGVVWFVLNTRKQGHQMLNKSTVQLTEADLAENT